MTSRRKQLKPKPLKETENEEEQQQQLILEDAAAAVEPSPSPPDENDDDDDLSTSCAQLAVEAIKVEPELSDEDDRERSAADSLADDDAAAETRHNGDPFGHEDDSRHHHNGDGGDLNDDDGEAQQRRNGGDVFGDVNGRGVVQRFFCGFCDAVFADTSQLQRHTLRSHADLDNTSRFEHHLAGNNNIFEPTTVMDEYARSLNYAPPSSSSSFGLSAPTHSYDCRRCHRRFDAILALHDHLVVCRQQQHQSHHSSSTSPSTSQQQPSPPAMGYRRRPPGGAAVAETTSTPQLQPRPYLCSVCKCTLPDLRAFAEHMRHHHHQQPAAATSPLQQPRQPEDNVAPKRAAASVSPVSAGAKTREQPISDEPPPKELKLTPPVYQCDCCAKTYADWNGRKMLVEHSMQHYLDETSAYECGGCVGGERYGQADDLQKHLLDIHAIPMYRCALCQQCFDSRVDIQVHFALVHSRDTSRFLCRSCHRVFATRAQFKVHLEAVHLTQHSAEDDLNTSSAAFKCSLCLEAFAVEFLFDRHMQTCHPESAFAVRPITNAYPRPSASPYSAAGGRPASGSSASGHSRVPIHRSIQPGGSSTTWRPAKCPVCDGEFASAALLAAHKLTHCRVTRCDVCAVCTQRLTGREDYLRHATTHLHKGQLRCVVCSQTLADSYELQIHADFHLGTVKTTPEKLTTTPSLDCDDISCSLQSLPVQTEESAKETSGRSSLPAKHSTSTTPLLDDNKSGRFQCIKCQKWFNSETAIKAHVTTHMLEEGVDHHCLLCNTVFNSPAKLQCHLIEHSYAGCREFRCYLCDAVFSMSQPLQQHMLDHTADEQPFECSFEGCDQKYFFRAEIDNHRLTRSHGTGDAVAVDNDGDTGDASRSTMATPPPPTSSAGADSPSSSAVIGRVSSEELLPDSTTGASVVSPISRDSGYIVFGRNTSASSFPEKLFGCPYCEKSFASHNALQGHSHVHMTRTKVHGKACNLCGKTFVNSTKLKNHTRLHTGEKPFTCGTCGKSFTRKDNLKAHARCHNNNTPSMQTGGSTAYSPGFSGRLPPSYHRLQHALSASSLPTMVPPSRPQLSSLLHRGE